MDSREESEQQLKLQADAATQVIVLHDFQPQNQPNKLSIRKGDILQVISKHNSGWWSGYTVNSKPLFIGWFPSSFVAELSEDLLKTARDQALQEDLQQQSQLHNGVQSISTPEAQNRIVEQRIGESNNLSQRDGASSSQTGKAQVGSSKFTLGAGSQISTWDVMIKRVLTSISNINAALKDQNYKMLIQDGNLLVTAVGNLVEQSQEALVLSNRSIQTGFEELVASCDKFVYSLKQQQSALIDQNGIAQIKSRCGHVLLAVRKYVTLCLDNDVKLSSRSKSVASQASFETITYNQGLSVVECEQHLGLCQSGLKSVLASILQQADLQKNVSIKVLLQASSQITAQSIQLITLMEDLHFDEILSNTRSEAKEFDILLPNDADIMWSTSAVKHQLNSAVANLMAEVDQMKNEFAPAHAQKSVLLSITSTLKAAKDYIATCRELLNYKSQLDVQLAMLNCDFMEQSVNSWRQLQQDIKAAVDATAKPSLGNRRSSQSDVDDDGGNQSSDSSSLDGESVTDLDRRRTQSTVESKRRRNFVSSMSAKSSLPKGTLQRSKKYEVAKSAQAQRKLSKFFGEDVATSDDNFSQGNSIKNINTELDDQIVEGATATNKRLKKFFGESPITLSYSPNQSNTEIFSWQQPDYSPSDLIFTLDGQKHVKAGTLAALVTYFVGHDNVDFDFVKTFLLTFRMFTTWQLVLDNVRARFQLQAPSNLSPFEQQKWYEVKLKPIQIRVFKALKMWMEDYWYEKEDGPHLDELKQFIKSVMYPQMGKEAERLIELVARRLALRNERSTNIRLSLARLSHLPIADASIPPAIPVKNGQISSILDIDALELCRQITLLEHRLFMAVHPMELLYYVPREGLQQNVGDESTDPIRQAIQRSNQITGWIAESILQQSDIKSRVAVLKHLIKTAEKCHELNNFASRESILAALNSTPIYRLRKTWAELSSKYQMKFETLCSHMDRENNFQKYRNALKELNAPCIPFLGRYLTDITFIKQGNPDYFSNKNLINFDKYRKLAAIIQEIDRFQLDSYKFVVVPDIWNWIQTHLDQPRDFSKLHELSLTLEPREKTIVQPQSQSSIDVDNRQSLMLEKEDDVAKDLTAKLSEKIAELNF
ncbi:hypothetical protein MP228_009136 [Amoeboaphelidium protococcarum]|nr:hypothetical protein MP228_009136 [Amoeboaphelidium protococcarum]